MTKRQNGYVLRFKPNTSNMHYLILNRLCEAAERHVLTKSHVECAVEIRKCVVDGKKGDSLNLAHSSHSAYTKPYENWPFLSI